ncbi:MAG: MBL fold metallo-hydrolase [Bacteroidetes bacterium]|nr:MBL fold metallo-hydrolase [Bacteroidota bacterium]
MVPGQHIKFGASELQIFFTPGHSPGSVSFFSESDQFVISGDVLFERSIGRTDLPGGNYDTLIESIVKELLPLGDDVVVYSGHGNPTTIGSEKRLNPFLREHVQNF